MRLARRRAELVAGEDGGITVVGSWRTCWSTSSEAPFNPSLPRIAKALNLSAASSLTF